MNNNNREAVRLRYNTTQVTFEFRGNSNAFPMDCPPGLSPVERLRYRIVSESVWIADCVAGGSYEGERGEGIRKADVAKLRGLQSELAFHTGIPIKESAK